MSDSSHSSGHGAAAAHGGHDDHGHGHSHDHDHGHDHDHDMAAHLKTYTAVFVALLIGTVITVAMYYVHFDSMALTIAIALFIASIKSFLVAGYFMHLLSERKMIYSILAVTMVFFFALGALTIWGDHDKPTGSDHKAMYVP